MESQLSHFFILSKEYLLIENSVAVNDKNLNIYR